MSTASGIESALRSPIPAARMATFRTKKYCDRFQFRLTWKRYSSRAFLYWSQRRLASSDG
jgi:hypothetical protein